MLNIQIINDSLFTADKDAINKLTEYTCKKYNINDAEISVAIVTDEAIAQVHSEFMDDDSTTDVMSFNLTEPDDSTRTFEMIVNADMACRIAEKRNTPPQSELLLYILHGLLHNIGFDDLNEEDFIEMHNAENEILQKLNYGRVFGDGKFGGK